VTNIDKQRVAAVRKLEALGYRYRDDEKAGERGDRACAGCRGPFLLWPEKHPAISHV